MTAGRRSAKEWAALVRAWKRSGETAAQFAESRALSPRTLAWWKWRLKQGDATAAVPSAVQLVPVRVSDDVRAHCDIEGELAWELEGPAGHVLRVRGRAAARALGEALAIVERGGRRR